MSDDYIERLRKVESNIESMLDFEQRALDRFGKPPINDEVKMTKYRDFTEPIARTITAYETALGYLREHFPELKENE